MSFLFTSSDRSSQFYYLPTVEIRINCFTRRQLLIMHDSLHVPPSAKYYLLWLLSFATTIFYYLHTIVEYYLFFSHPWSITLKEARSRCASMKLHRWKYNGTDCCASIHVAANIELFFCSQLSSNDSKLFNYWCLVSRQYHDNSCVGPTRPWQ